MFRTEIVYAAKQNRVPVIDVFGISESYTMVNAAVSYTAKLPNASALFFLKANNIGDRLAFNASSVDTIRGLAPLPGCGIKAGVQLSF